MKNIHFIISALIVLFAGACSILRKPQGLPSGNDGKISLVQRMDSSMYNISVLASSDEHLSINIKVDGFIRQSTNQKKVTFHALKIPEAGMMTAIGRPNLPVIRKLIAVPNGKTIRVRIVDTSQVLLEHYYVYPVQQPVPEQGPYETKFTIDRKFYRTKAWYPKEIVAVSDPMILRGQTVVQLEIFPIQYLPAKKTIKAHTGLKVEIDFIEAGGTHLVQPDSFPPPVGFMRQYEKAINFDWLRTRFFPGPIRLETFLIITADDFVDEIAPFAAYKRQKGFRTIVEKMSLIGSTETELRNYIKNAYQKMMPPPSYVLLVGDAEFIPVHIHKYSSNNEAASDLYYATVDGDDILPDIAIGRFSAKTGSEVTGMVNKTIAYERNPVLDPDDWLSRISLISDAGYFESTSEWVYEYLKDKGFEVDRFYHSTGTATTANISGAANEGRLVLSYRGHGSVNSWGTGPFRNSDILALTNNRMLPILVSPTCLTGDFDNPSMDCFGETWLKAGGETGETGGVAYWGSSNISFGGYNDELCKGFYKAIYEDGLESFGDITNQAKLYMMNVYGTAGTAETEFYLFNVIGDPELKPWFYTPSLLHVSPRSLTFEQTMVGKTSRNQWINLRNLGEQNLQIQNMTTSSTSFTVEVKGKLLCGSTSPVLDTFGECNIFINFRPAQAKTYRDSLNITYYDGKTVSIPLYGTGIPRAPDIRVSYGNCTSFGNVQVGQTSKPCRVSIRNDGLNNLNARIAPNIELAFEWRREGNRACEDATPVIAPGNSCDITVYFKPIKPGYQKSNLRIYSDDPDTPEVTVPLEGHGLPGLVISPKRER